MGQTQTILSEMQRTWPGFPNVPQYGTQVVFLGYSVTTTMPTVWADIWGNFGGKDYFGNNLASLPMMTQLNPSHTLRDYGCVVGLIGWTGFNWVEIHEWGVNYMISYGGVSGLGGSRQSFAIGQLQGYVAGAAQGMEMEILSGIPGTNSLLTTTPILTALYIIFGVAISNVWYFNKGRRKEGIV